MKRINKMKYLLDTNAYFNILKELYYNNGVDKFTEVISSDCYISQLSLIEIMSVVGKYARGVTPQKQKCARILVDGSRACEHEWYEIGRNKMKPKVVKGWLKVINEIETNTHKFIKLTVLPINNLVLLESRKFIEDYSFRHNFGSHDAIIAGTSRSQKSICEDICIVTSDKGLKAALIEDGIKVFDPC
jgi:rRNA-processing protein FCF1